MKKETYVTPEIEQAVISAADVLAVSNGDIEINVGESGTGFF